MLEDEGLSGVGVLLADEEEVVACGEVGEVEVEVVVAFGLPALEDVADGLALEVTDGEVGGA